MCEARGFQAELAFGTHFEDTGLGEANEVWLRPGGIRAACWRTDEDTDLTGGEKFVGGLQKLYNPLFVRSHECSIGRGAGKVKIRRVGNLFELEEEAGGCISWTRSTMFLKSSNLRGLVGKIARRVCKISRRVNVRAGEHDKDCGGKVQTDARIGKSRECF